MVSVKVYFMIGHALGLDGCSTIVVTKWSATAVAALTLSESSAKAAVWSRVCAAALMRTVPVQACRT